MLSFCNRNNREVSVTLSLKIQFNLGLRDLTVQNCVQVVQESFFKLLFDLTLASDLKHGVFPLPQHEHQE